MLPKLSKSGRKGSKMLPKLYRMGFTKFPLDMKNMVFFFWRYVKFQAKLLTLKHLTVYT